MTIKEICESIINYDDDNLSTTLEAAILDGTTVFRGLVGYDDYILYTNSASSISITSITLDPDDDGEDVLELVIDNDNIHGLITMTEFATDYTFLNDKVAEIQSGTDDDGDVYKYIRFDTATDFAVEYVAETHLGTLASIWHEDMQRVIAYLSVATFIPMARRIAEDTVIYNNEGYGDANKIPTSVTEMNQYCRIYKKVAHDILRNYYVRLHNANNSG